MADDQDITYRGDDELAEVPPTPGAPADEELEYRGDSKLADAGTASDAEEAPDVAVSYRGADELADGS